jgi:hypothetical protein
MTILGANGTPIRPTPGPYLTGAPVFGYSTPDCTILFVITPFKATEMAVLGTNSEDLRFLLGINPLIIFQTFPLKESPGPGFYVWRLDFKATEKPSITNTNRPDLGFFTKEIRPATTADFKANGFNLPDLAVGTPSMDDPGKSSVQL